MREPENINQAMQDMLVVIQQSPVTVREAAIAWGGVGQVIFGGGGLRDSDEAYELMIQFLQSKCCGPVPGTLRRGAGPNQQPHSFRPLQQLGGVARRLLRGPR